MEEAGTGLAGLQGREDRQEESPGKIQLPRRLDRPDREPARGVQVTDRTGFWAGGESMAGGSQAS